MTRNEIISQLFTGKNFNDCIHKMEPEHLQDDLRMEVIAIVCEWPDEKIIGLHERKELDFFVVRVILNQIQSNSSPFYKKFRKTIDAYDEQGAEGFFGVVGEGVAIARHRANVVERATEASFISHAEDIDDRQQREELEERALQGIDSLYWYKAGLLKLYARHGNYRAIEKETGIPFVSCYHTIRKSIKELKEKVLCSTGT